MYKKRSIIIYNIKHTFNLYFKLTARSGIDHKVITKKNQFYADNEPLGRASFSDYISYIFQISLHQETVPNYNYIIVICKNIAIFTLIIIYVH